MQTERVTFLTSPDNKAALDAYAASNGRSVGHVLREASSTYMAAPAGGGDTKEGEAALEALVVELEGAIPAMQSDFEAMRRDVAAANVAIEDYLRDKGRRGDTRAAA